MALVVTCMGYKKEAVTESIKISTPSGNCQPKTILDRTDYITPWANMASATFTKPAILAPFT
jgi:hypothetical protein